VRFYTSASAEGWRRRFGADFVELSGAAAVYPPGEETGHFVGAEAICGVTAGKGRTSMRHRRGRLSTTRRRNGLSARAPSSSSSEDAPYGGLHLDDVSARLLPA